MELIRTFLLGDNEQLKVEILQRLQQQGLTKRDLSTLLNNDRSVVNKSVNFLEQLNLVKECGRKSGWRGEWGRKYATTEDGKLISCLIHDVYENFPKPNPANPKALGRINSALDVLFYTKTGKGSKNAEHGVAELLTYKWECGKAMKVFSKPLIDKGFISDGETFCSKDVFEVTPNRQLLTHFPDVVVLPNPDMDVKTKRKLDEIFRKQLSFDNQEFRHKFKVCGRTYTVTSSYLVLKQGISLKDVKEILYHEGAVVCMVMATMLEEWFGVRIRPVTFNELLSEAKITLDQSTDISSNKSKIGFLFKDSMAIILRNEFPDCQLYNFTPRISELIVMERTYAESKENCEVMGSIIKRIEELYKLGKDDNRLRMSISHVQGLPRLFKEYDFHCIKELSEITERARKMPHD